MDKYTNDHKGNCLKWCNDNPMECSRKLRSLCGDTINNKDNINCHCHKSQDFYEKWKDTEIKDDSLKIGLGSVGNHMCWYPDCLRLIEDKLTHIRQDHCKLNSLRICINHNLHSLSDIGSVEMINECGDTYNQPPSQPPSQPPPQPPNEDDTMVQKWVFKNINAVALFSFIMLIIIVLIFV